MTNHPVSPFGPATPPKEGNRTTPLKPSLGQLTDASVTGTNLAAKHAVPVHSKGPQFPSLGGVAAEPPGWFSGRLPSRPNPSEWLTPQFG